MVTDVRTRLAARLAVMAAVLSTLLVGFAPPPAHAELFSPRQPWLRNATAGLFLHWGLRTTRPDPPAPPSRNPACAAWEAEATNTGRSAAKGAPGPLSLHRQ